MLELVGFGLYALLFVMIAACGADPIDKAQLAVLGLALLGVGWWQRRRWTRRVTYLIERENAAGKRFERERAGYHAMIRDYEAKLYPHEKPEAAS